MILQPENDAFWRSDDCFIAVNPHRPHDAEGLAGFASQNIAMRGLLYFQTSGSDGIPKWVGLSRAAFLASAKAVNTHFEASGKDRWLIALSLHHVGGFSILARCHASGASFSQFSEKWNAQRFATVCVDEKITLTSLVPTQVFDLVSANITAPAPLRAVIVGGGALNKNLGLRATELGWPLLQSYGMTETASQIATEPLDHLYSGFDPDTLEVLPGLDLQTDAESRLIIRGASLANGYATKSDGEWRWLPFDAAIGFGTRDFVSIWQHGTRYFLRVIGRETSFVKIKGELVNVAALQSRLEVLLQETGLSPNSATVWSQADQRVETKLILVGEIPDLEGLQARFNAISTGCERLSKVRRVSQIPRGDLGKINAQALAQLMRESLESPW